jgi:2-polyprenyl-3-methyl-5-hydroxy-6-metoxy-1,4-benzoquinol methylase
MKKLCSYCNTESGLYFRSRDYNRQVTQEIFDHYRCPRCGLIFISPIPQNLGDYYPQEYHFIPETVEFLKQNAAHEKYKIEIIQRYVKQGRMLEIGPSLGCFTYLAKQSGFEAEAIEIDARCSKFLNEVAGIPTVNSSDTCGALKTIKPFDVIAIWHVIEHLPNPWETLEAINEKINAGGILVLAAPNPNAFQFHILRRYWPHVDAPRHLMLIPAQLLIDKMATMGMTVELVTTTDEGGLVWNVFGWDYFFSNLCRYSRINRILRKLGRMVARLVGPIETKEGKGSAYTMIFRKVA